MIASSRRTALLGSLVACAGIWTAPPMATRAETNTGAALTPPMGWSSGSSEGCGATEQSALAEGRAMAASLESHGYQYINLDCHWDNHSDAYGRRVWDPAKFPDGIPYLANQLHSMGLKMGIYLNPGIYPKDLAANLPILGTPYHLHDIALPGVQGNTTGQGFTAIDFTKPGSHEYIQSMADLYASWGVDWFKMDFVGPGGGNVPADNRTEMQVWNEAIVKTGRPMVMDISNSLSFANAAWWKQYTNAWRIEGDIECYCGGPPPLTSWTKVLRRFADLPKWVPYSGPGGWNDLDSLELGNGANDGMTPDQRQSAMTLWSIASAPLILGADLTKMDPTDLGIMTNDEVIAVNQAGISAAPLTPGGTQQVWVAHEKDGSYVVALFNLGTAAATVSVTWSQLGFSGSARIHDLYSHTDLASSSTGFGATINASASRLVRVYPPGGGPVAPGAATGVMATANGGGQATVSWMPPTDTGSGPIGGYAVYAYGTDGSTQEQVTLSSSYTFTGLNPSVYYAFTVTTWNGSLWGPWSGWSAWTLMT